LDTQCLKKKENTEIYLRKLRKTGLQDMKNLQHAGSDVRSMKIEWVETGGRIINVLEEG
jgi:hypothetical protein